MFFIISLSEAIYLRSFCGMCECNIQVFDFVFNIHKHISLVVQVDHCYVYVLSMCYYV